MKIHVCLHNADDDGRLARIERKLDQMRIQTMATAAEIIALLQEANTQTDNIAADLQRLVNEATSLEEVQAGTQALVDRLTAVAAVVPEPGAEPPV